MSGYVCTNVNDLDMRLDSKLKNEFQSLFYDFDASGLVKTPKRRSWRMFFGGMTPEKFFSRLGVDFDNPTVRIAVALDMIKLHDGDLSDPYDGSVSNFPNYTFMDNSILSPLEIERKILNRNYRVNLVNLEPCNRMVKVGEQTIRMETIEKVYQGLILDDSILKFMSQAIDLHESNQLDQLYVPVCNGQSAIVDLSLITHTHADFSARISRAYYDQRYQEYKNRIKDAGLECVSSFALVDSNRGKTHTGSFLIKGMKIVNGEYYDVVIQIDKDGGILIKKDGNPKLVFHKNANKSRIISVCELDFLANEYDSSTKDNEWSEYSEVDVPIAKYTTSSRYSVFKQRIPNYELKDIRNYINYRNRLQGMEVCLEQLERSIWLKEVQCSDMFVQRTLALWKFMREFGKCQSVIELTIQGYKFVSEIDRIDERMSKLRRILLDRNSELQKLLDEYLTIDRLGSKQLARKMELGGKIRSLKIEIDGNIKSQLESLLKQRNDVLAKIDNLNQSIIESCQSNEIEFDEQFKSKFVDLVRGNISEKREKLKLGIANNRKLLGLPQRDEQNVSRERNDELIDSVGHPDIGEIGQDIAEEDSAKGLIVEFDTTKLENLNKVVKKMNSRMFNLGWELMKMKQMRSVCSDATIRVRRMLRNFKDMILKTRQFVWDDDSMSMRSNIDFSMIQIPNMRNIILLHEWFAVNPDKEDYGMDWVSECKFRVRCREIALNLRRREYSIMLNEEKIRLQDIINDTRTKMSEIGYVKFNDVQEKSIQEQRPWSLDDVGKSQLDRILPFVEVMESIQEKIDKDRQYNIDLTKLKDRTIGYLVDSGLISSKDDIESLAARNIVSNNINNPHILNLVESLCKRKNKLNYAIDRMIKYKQTISSIIDSLTKCEIQISKLKEKNGILIDNILSAKKMNRAERNKLLLEKIENESKIQELQDMLRLNKDSHLSDIHSLECMRDEVDKLQNEYDKMLSKFKQDIGLTRETIENLVIGIYNKYQDEILNNEVN